MNTFLKRSLALATAVIILSLCTFTPMFALEIVDGGGSPSVVTFGPVEDVTVPDDGVDLHFVFDDANLLSDEEEANIEKKLKELGEKYGISVGIVFLDTCGGNYRDIAEFNADLYESLYGRETDGVLFTIVMDTRDWDINTSGICRDAYGWSELNDFEEDVIPCLADGRYADAAYAYAEHVDNTLDSHTNKTFPLGEIICVSLFVGFVIALVSVLVMKGQLKSVRANNNANSYVKKDSLAITSSGDIFLYRNVVKTPRQTQSSSGGGYRRSSSGGSYGGRSGKF